MTAPTTTVIDIAEGHLQGGDNGTADVVARIAQRPVALDLFPDEDRAARHIALPEGWNLHAVDPEDPREAPDALKGVYVTKTAAGFARLVDELSSGHTGSPRYTVANHVLTALIDPGSLESPSFEQLTARLSPCRSEELLEWTAVCNKWMPGAEWAKFVEDHLLDINDEHPGSPLGLEVLEDARSWHIEAKRTVRRVAAEDGGAEDIDEYVARQLGTVITRFTISVPVLEFGDDFNLPVILARDLEKQLIQPRIPGIDRFVNQAIDAELDNALEALEVSAIR